MAKTAAQIINVLKKGDVFRSLNDSSFAMEIANKAIHLFWGTYSWRDTLEDMPVFYPIPNEADHVAPDIQIPADFWALDIAQVRNINGEEYDLKIMQRLPRASYQDWPTAISYMPSIAGFRLHPLPGSGISAPWVQVECVYKKTPPTITDNNFDTLPIPLDEMYQDVYEQAIRYKYFETLGDSRAGEVVRTRGVAQYTGQLGRYMASVQSAIGRENIHRGEEIDAPASPLALGGFPVIYY